MEWIRLEAFYATLRRRIAASDLTLLDLHKNARQSRRPLSWGRILSGLRLNRHGDSRSAPFLPVLLSTVRQNWSGAFVLNGTPIDSYRYSLSEIFFLVVAAVDP